MTARIKTLQSGQADEHVIRIIAYFVIYLVAIGLQFHLWYIHALLAFDFAIRAFGNSRFSILKLLAARAAKLGRVPVKPIYAAPKKFAALLGCVFSAGIALSQLLHADIVAIVLGSVLLLCAALASFFGFCAGCYVFHFFQKIVNNK